MKQVQNVIYDFCNTKLLESQPVAVMPAGMARKLLEFSSFFIRNMSFEEIKADIIKDLHQAPTIEELELRALSFIQMRELLDNVEKKNWSAYSVLEEDEGVSVIKEVREAYRMKSQPITEKP